jgi:hypothetical protein
MADKSKIEWTEATTQRARATAAARLGITVAEYAARRIAGEKWCTACRAWQPVEAFDADRSRGDGRKSSCRDIANARARAAYAPKERPTPGRRFVDPRSDDQKQARRRVNHLVVVGLLPHPNAMPCTDCGHVWADGERRHEYDHHHGYDAQHHEDVEAVCTTCHHRREDERRAN